MSTSQKTDRYPGRWVFRPDQSEIFFGREKEKEELFHLVRQSQVVVVFAKSGVGKSSLLNAGLSPLLLAAGYQPVKIMFTRTKETEDLLTQTPLSIFKQRLECYFTKKEIPINSESPRLWEYFKQCSFDEGRIPVLIFDQFEELFGYPIDEIKKLLSEFSEIIHERPPSRIIQWLLNIETANRTSEQMAWASQPAVKFIFAIRSDRLSEIQMVNEIIPGIFSNRYPLLPMTETNARDAIQMPADIEDDHFKSPRFSFEKKSLQKIVNGLKDDYTAEIELSQLQIVCNYIEEKVKTSRDEGKQIKLINDEVFDAEKEIEKVLQNNYELQLSQVGSSEDAAICRNFLEENLLENRTRVRLPKGAVMKYLKTEALIDSLLSTRLIKVETDINGATYYQISHDSLIDPILNLKMQRELEERKENDKLRELAQAEEIRKNELAEAEQLKRDHYKCLESKHFQTALETLSKAMGVFDKYNILKESIETRLLIVKIYAVTERLPEAKTLLDETLGIVNEKNDLSLIGRVNEDFASFYENQKENHTSFDYYKRALINYKTIFDSPQTARLAEHLGGFKEQLYDNIIGRNNLEEPPERVIMESKNYYDEALKAYTLVQDIFGTKRVQRSIDRVTRLVNPWGYLTELYTGIIHPMKGKTPIRIGRDVKDPISQVYTLKNEIGFPRDFNFMSRRHLSITPDLVIEDTQSLNGTTINTIPLYYGNPRVLRDGDIIVLANMLPLRFSVDHPSAPEIPNDYWGILITGTSKTFHYLKNEQVVSVSLIPPKATDTYELKIEQFDNEDALIRFKSIDGVPSFFTEEKLEVLEKITNDVTETHMGKWNIRTTIKDADRFYKDYILYTGNWFKALDSPLQPQLVAAGQEGTEGETILFYGPTFQMIAKPAYYDDFKIKN